MYDQLVKDPSLPVSSPTQSYWQSPTHEGLFGIQSPQLPKQRDIVIIGSGITACSVSRELLVNNKYSGTITILEAREVCSGATGRNGGRINCVAVLDFEKYSRLFGVEAAKNIVRFELSHFDAILEAAQSLGPELFDKSEVRVVETVAAVFSQTQLDRLKTALAQFEDAMPELAGRWTITENAEDMFKIKNAKGALLGEAGAAWPYRLITFLFAKLLQDHEKNLSIETNTPALDISRDISHDYPYEVKTPRGTIRAKHIVHCTEGHTAHLLPGLRGILVPRRGQMSVQNPGSAFKHSDGKRSWSFYHTVGFDYLSQNSRTGEIFIGGGELGGMDSGLDIHGISSDAEEYLPAKSHLTGILPVVFGQEGWGAEKPGKPHMQASWTGILCNSLDRVPIVGMLPQEALGPRLAGTWSKGAEWISAGYGGYGMVNSWFCAKAVAQQILGNGVPPWLPAEYALTSDRMGRLRQRLDEVKGTERHLRALL